MFDNNLTLLASLDIATALQHNKTLRKLYLGKNDFELDGINNICKSLDINNTLEVIDFGILY